MVPPPPPSSSSLPAAEKRREEKNIWRLIRHRRNASQNANNFFPRTFPSPLLPRKYLTGEDGEGVSQSNQIRRRRRTCSYLHLRVCVSRTKFENIFETITTCCAAYAAFLPPSSSLAIDRRSAERDGGERTATAAKVETHELISHMWHILGDYVGAVRCTYRRLKGAAFYMQL